MNPRSDPAVRLLCARRRLCRMRMRREGKLALAGYAVPQGADVQSIWRRYGWSPTNRVVVVTVQIKEAA